MKRYYAKNYENALQFAWNTELDFHESTSKEHIGEITCLDLYEGDQIIIKIFWDESIYHEAPNFYKI